MKIYTGQTALRMTFEMSADITGYSQTEVDVLKPSASTTTWTATVSDVSTGSIYYDIPTTTVLDTTGKYRFQPRIVFSDGTIGKAEQAEIMVYDTLI